MGARVICRMSARHRCISSLLTSLSAVPGCFVSARPEEFSVSVSSSSSTVDSVCVDAFRRRRRCRRLVFEPLRSFQTDAGPGDGSSSFFFDASGDLDEIEAASTPLLLLLVQFLLHGSESFQDAPHDRERTNGTSVSRAAAASFSDVTSASKLDSPQPRKRRSGLSEASESLE